MKDPEAICPQCESSAFLTYDEESGLYHCDNPEWYRNSNPQQRFQCDDHFTSEQIAETKGQMRDTVLLAMEAAKKYGFGFSVGDRVIVEPKKK